MFINHSMFEKTICKVGRVPIAYQIIPYIICYTLVGIYLTISKLTMGVNYYLRTFSYTTKTIDNRNGAQSQPAR
jgi:hypothetical protein